MKSKVWKALILVLFVGALISAAWWMFNRFSLQSPYYQEQESESRDTGRLE